MLGHRVTDDGSVVLGNRAVAIGILKLHHTWEGHLTLWCVVGLVAYTCVVDGTAVIGHTALQGPYAIVDVEVVDGVESG